MADEWKTAEVYFIRSQALCAPAVRMLVVEGWAWRERGKAGMESGVVLKPVVALRSIARRSWTKDFCGSPPSLSGTEKQLEADGWELTGESVRLAVVVADDDCGLDDYDDERLLEHNVVRRVVSCPWPSEEDAVRLKSILDEVERSARDREEWRSAKRYAEPVKAG